MGGGCRQRYGGNSRYSSGVQAYMGRHTEQIEQNVTDNSDTAATTANNNEQVS